MSDQPVRIAMWSGPRNISTAMMRAFENRPDTAVVDEPFYAAYLHLTGLDHPMRDEVLASQPTDWRAVAETMTGPAPEGASIFYQKQMCHHMLPAFGLGWMDACTNVFLIRNPADVVASCTEKRAEITLADIGVVRQAELFEREADRLGHAPVVIESADVAKTPQAALRSLCAALAIPFTGAMLNWPAGPRASDGVWAPAWYDQVERSTGFRKKASPSQEMALLAADLHPIVEQAAPYYERLSKHALKHASG